MTETATQAGACSSRRGRRPPSGRSRGSAPSARRRCTAGSRAAAGGSGGGRRRAAKPDHGAEQEAGDRLLGGEQRRVPEHLDQQRAVASRRLEQLPDDVVEVREGDVVDHERAERQLRPLADPLEALPERPEAGEDEQEDPGAAKRRSPPSGEPRRPRVSRSSRRVGSERGESAHFRDRQFRTVSGTVEGHRLRERHAFGV